MLLLTPLSIGDDLDFLREEANTVQDEGDSPAGMISYDEWVCIWDKFPAEGLRDKVHIFYFSF